MILTKICQWKRISLVRSLNKYEKILTLELIHQIIELKIIF